MLYLHGIIFFSIMHPLMKKKHCSESHGLYKGSVVRAETITVEEGEGKRFIKGTIPLGKPQLLRSTRGLDVYEILSADVLRKADATRLTALYNHDVNYVLGSKRAGTLNYEIREDAIAYSVEMPRGFMMDSIYDSIARGDVVESSFRMVGIDYIPTIALREGKEVLEVTLTEVREFMDVSPVTYAAYSDSMSIARNEEMAKDTYRHVLHERNKVIEQDNDLKSKLLKIYQSSF